MALKKILALVLTIVFVAMHLSNTELSGRIAMSSAVAQEETGGLLSTLKDNGFLPHDDTEDSITWMQGAEQICRMLGYVQKDTADIDLTDSVTVVSGLSHEDASAYLGLLAEKGYLAGIGGINDPQDDMPWAEYNQLLSNAFNHFIDSQEKADALTVVDASGNFAVWGDDIHLSALNTDRMVLGTSDRVTLSGLKGDVVSILGADNTYLYQSKTIMLP